MKKIFRKDFFVIECAMNGLAPYDNYIVAKLTWASDCDGKEVVDGMCLGKYVIQDDWCEIVEG